MADYISSHTGSQIDAGISKTDHITDGTYTLASTPAIGDWRIRQHSDNHLKVERQDTQGNWEEYGDYGSSFTTSDLILKDDSGALYYTKSDDTKQLMLTSSRVDDGTAVGSITGGVSLVSNGRLESFLVNSSTTNLPVQNDGTDTDPSSSNINIITPTDASAYVMSRLFIYLSNVPLGTRARLTIDDYHYENVSEYDFKNNNKGFGVSDGENLLLMSPNVRIPAGVALTFNIEFSNPVTVIGKNTSQGFSPKYYFAGRKASTEKIVTIPNHEELKAIGSIAKGAWVFENGKIYTSNSTGIQTGTFADNSAKWDILMPTLAKGTPGELMSYDANGLPTSTGESVSNLVKNSDRMTTAIANADKTATINFGDGKIVTMDAKAWFNGGTLPPQDSYRVWWGFDTRAVPQVSDVKDGQSRDIRSLGGEDFTATRSGSTLAKYVFIWVPDSLGAISHIEVGGLHDTWKSYTLTVDNVAGKTYVSDNKTFSTSYRFRVGTDYVY